MNSFYLKSAIVRDGFFGGPLWEWLPEVGTPQPKEGWELLPPEFSIWRDEVAYVVKTPWEDLSEVLFERWNEMTEGTADNCFDKEECRRGWSKGTLDGADVTIRAMLEFWHDGVWGEEMQFEEWAKRMEVSRLIKSLQAEWDTYRTHKRWYILIPHNAAPMVASLTFLLSRLNSDKAYYLTFGPTTILSAATVERLMEADAFAGLSLVGAEEDEKSSIFEKIKTSLGLGTGLFTVNDRDDTQSWLDTVLQAAAKRRNIIINPNIARHFSDVAPQWTHISPENHCDIILGFHNLSPADYQYTLKHLRPGPAPEWPLFTFDLWKKLDGFPTWEGMYDMYYGRGSWDNVGPTSQNKTRLISGYWGLEYAEYDDGSWSIIHEDISNDCQEICYQGGISPEPHPTWEDTRGKQRRCLAYKSEVLGLDGEVLESMYGKDGLGRYGEGWSGLTKCTFAPWKVVGEKAAKWSMVNDDGGMEGQGEWKECPELDGRQFVEPRLFADGRRGAG